MKFCLEYINLWQYICSKIMSISWSLHETKCHIFLNSLKIPLFINTFKKINVNLSTKEKKKNKKKSMFHEHPMCLGAKVHELKKYLEMVMCYCHLLKAYSQVSPTIFILISGELPNPPLRFPHWLQSYIKPFHWLHIYIWELCKYATLRNNQRN